MSISLRNVNIQNKRIEMSVENEQSFVLGRYKILKLIDMWGATHAHQAKILKYPQNENFIPP
ncbi:hypothetical protein [Bacillus cereus]|uniref:hypothetical protein n=1 Tax=Bacillus cereus TaxID=1396 RepID=UPI0015CF701C|nr:hypothetical protein [Bacillus cereus]